MGPTAQDFRAAFGLGADGRHLAPVDTNGVALAAIQGLNQLVEEKDAQIASLEERIADLGKTIGGTDKAKAMFIERQPMGRLGKPSEIAMLAVYLASDESAFTTGTMQVIDGGWTL